MVLLKFSSDVGSDDGGDVSSKKQNKALLTPLIQLHPLPSEDGLLIKIQPPKEPKDHQLGHVPCDIVLCIDVSGSMGASAPVPELAGEAQEDFGLSVLDLVKHAARTIVETLDSRDRLGIVTFASGSKVLQPLIPMTTFNKAMTLMRIDEMRPLTATNLWHGIRDGLGLFGEAEAGSDGRVPALLVLTDGAPNFCCPHQGYIPKLRTMEPLPATIHTFGFGYSLRSGLLKSIAAVSGGNYSFIPDAGMIGTAFIHAVANLQSTFANKATLRLTYPSFLDLEEATGDSVEKQAPVKLGGDVPQTLSQLTILLGNLQYGQSRDIYLRYGGTGKASLKLEAGARPEPIVTAILEYQHFTPTIHSAVTHQNILGSHPPLDPAEIAYHVSRSALISFLSSLFPSKPNGEHDTVHPLPPDLLIRAQLKSLACSLPAFNEKFLSCHEGCRSLFYDLCGSTIPFTAVTTATPNPEEWTGQIALGLTNGTYYTRWGRHYLPSLAGAHARQVCNSFKDAGPRIYGADSPLFIACRDRLDRAFDALPAPTPSLLPGAQGAHDDFVLRDACRHRRPGGVIGLVGIGHSSIGRQLSMKYYNDPNGACFAGCAIVALAGGIMNGKEKGSLVRVGRLRRGMSVLTPRGPRRVVTVLRTAVRRAGICLVGGSGAGSSAKGGVNAGLWVTPWHPVFIDGAWRFPADVAKRSARYTGSVYSVLLERDDDAEAHAILVDGMWAVTLGHGLVDGGEGEDVRVHRFFGNYDLVARMLGRLPKRSGGRVLGGGVTRDHESGLINGFRMPGVRLVN